MVDIRPGGLLNLRVLLLFALLVSSQCWVLGGKKGSKDATLERSSHTKNLHSNVQPKLPPTSFVRIFALPSEEAKMAQVSLETFLAVSAAYHSCTGCLLQCCKERLSQENPFPGPKYERGLFTRTLSRVMSVFRKKSVLGIHLLWLSISNKAYLRDQPFSNSRYCMHLAD